MTIMNQYNRKLEQIYVNIALLHGDLEKITYIEKSQYVVQHKDKICLMEKYLYDLKKNLRKWYRRFKEVPLYMVL